MIDGWRALACSIVVVFHGVCGCPPAGRLHEILQIVVAHGKNGWIGRNLLFMLSGYCLARSIERRAQSPRPLAFWRDRLLRIYLTYWAALATAILLALVATPFNGLSLWSPFPDSPKAWLGDLSLAHIWIEVRPKLLVSWSLSYELGFYLLVGAALFPLLRGPKRRFALAAAVTAIACLSPAPDFLPLLGLWPIFACGLAVHAALSPTLPLPFRLVALAYPPVLALSHLPSGGGQVTVPALLSIVFLLTVAFARFLPALPRVVTFVGAASYSIFLIHIPVMSPALNLAKRLLPNDGALFAAVWFAHILLGFAGGILFYRWVERPIEAWRRRVFSSGPTAPSGSAAAP